MISNINLGQQLQVIEHLRAVPYDVTPTRLYTAASLYQGYDPDTPSTFPTCYDSRVYQHYLQTGKLTDNVAEDFARTLHDHRIHTAMREFLDTRNPIDCVGIMGGHALLRTDPMYREIVLISKQLTEHGFLMISGGGPGAMEATHLGAWMAGRTLRELDDALAILMPHPTFQDPAWLASAFRVMQRYPQDPLCVSLGIPTWLYGHEPATPFATHIAKLFENSLREDSILTLAYGGIIYAPGSAGTMQEIFQDAVQNHYLSFGFSSPMVFLGRQFWTEEMPAYTLLSGMMQTGKYRNLLLTLSDDSQQIIAAIEAFREKAKSEKK